MNRHIESIINLSRPVKRLLMLLFDLLFLPVALWLALSMRLGEAYVPGAPEAMLFLAAPLVALPVFLRMGLYRAVVRYMGHKALWTVARAVTLSALLWGIVVLLSGLHHMPRSAVFIYWLVALLGIGGSRMVARFILSGAVFSRLEGRKVVIYGAGQAGMQLASAMQHGSGLDPVAYLDDEPGLRGHVIAGLPVYHPCDLEQLFRDYPVEQVLLALPSASRARRNEILSLFEPYPVHIRTLPSLNELVQGRVELSALRDIEIEDLLGRDPVPPDDVVLKACITGKSVLVTGAGGSIGSELCRQIIRLEPSRLVLLERSEFVLYQIEQELLRLQAELGVQVDIVALLGSVNHRRRAEKVCATFAIDTVYHAAAYKHVPLVEGNPIEAVINNIFGTLHMAQAASSAGVSTFVLISTDKAVRPTNVMGATKRVAELILQALADCGEGKTVFCMVRFGNVLDSSGSVVPLFRKQIRRGGPITVTHAEIVRYFMTIPEAAQLVLQAGAMAEGGDVFVLDMGEPVRIYDLARRMVRLSGLREKSGDQSEGDIEIRFTGLRPGEKLFEELLIGGDVRPTGHPKIMRAHEAKLTWEELQSHLQEMHEAAAEFNHETVRRILMKIVQGYSPEHDIIDHVWAVERGGSGEVAGHSAGR